LSFSAIIGNQTSSTNIHASEKLQSSNHTLLSSCHVERTETSLIIGFADREHIFEILCSDQDDNHVDCSSHEILGCPHLNRI